MSIRSREINLVGAFYAVGITGHPQFRVVTLWDCHGGWEGGWRQMMEIYQGVDRRLFLSDIDDLRFSAPLLAEHGHTLVGLYEVLFCDTEAVILWAVSLDDHLATQRARDAALGLDDEVTPDSRLLAWGNRARDYLDGRWRETLLAPYPGCRLAPVGRPD
ncbi:hypothetical protein [Nonomuraea jiangxiensis]|uniref:Uncharacterized protein n=1 Tax=Nonomuraea jiangxiensis TaxID=633440 RepID=A0A1G8RM70_9ACTN|nr:hypothetical protein [Nonomuraea jiangxiensis]SDJ17595.1 hypothetical protein SAMN05421869_109105 [Nonomuraea jiangxiensis]